MTEPKQIKLLVMTGDANRHINLIKGTIGKIESIRYTMGGTERLREVIQYTTVHIVSIHPNDISPDSLKKYLEKQFSRWPSGMLDTVFYRKAI